MQRVDLGANGTVEAGHEVQVVLFGDAVVIMKDVVADSVVPVGWPPLKELMATTIKNNARGVSEADLQGKNATFTNPKTTAELVAAATNVVSA